MCKEPQNRVLHHPTTDDIPRPLQILVAEDDPEMRRMLASALRRDGYEVVVVSAGDQLLEKLESDVLRGSRTYPDLIVSDIRMPGCSGIEVLAGLRRADWATPVILISAFADGETHAEAKRLGATLFEKPFDIDELRTAVMNVVGAVGHV